MSPKSNIIASASKFIKDKLIEFIYLDYVGRMNETYPNEEFRVRRTILHQKPHVVDFLPSIIYPTTFNFEHNCNNNIIKKNQLKKLI